jgi:hypothetical protein
LKFSKFRGNEKTKTDTFAWLYCTKHAEDVQCNFRNQVVQIELAQEAKAGKRVEQQISKPKAKRTSQNRPPVLDSSIPRKSSSVTIAASSSKQAKPNIEQSQPADLLCHVPKKPRIQPVGKPPPAAATAQKPHRDPRPNKYDVFWGQVKTKDRHAVEQTTMANPVNVGERVTLAKKRRDVADRKYKSNYRFNDMIDRIVEDLMEQHKTTGNVAYKVRMVHWKRELSEIGTEEFKQIFKEAKTQFKNLLASGDGDETGQGTAQAKPSADLADGNNPTSTNEDKETDNDNDNDSVNTEMMDPDTGWDLDSGKDKEDNSLAEETAPASAAHEEERLRPSNQPKRPLINRWAHLFLGPTYKIDHQFTLGEFEEEIS